VGGGEGLGDLVGPDGDDLRPASMGDHRAVHHSADEEIWLPVRVLLAAWKRRSSMGGQLMPAGLWGRGPSIMPKTLGVEY